MVNTLIGLWMATALIYQGQTIPLPNPDLRIYYTFEDTGVNTMRYYRENENGSCTRKAVYEFSSNTLKQHVVWTSPENASWCSQDVDMQLEYKSWTQAELKDGKFYLYAQMGEENLIYVWERVEPSLK